MANLIRAAIYARVSLEDQAEQYGLAAQLSVLRKYSEDHGYTVANGHEFVDDGYLGGDLERPALTRLRAAIRAKRIDVLLVVDLDRLARNLGHLLLLYEETEANDVRLETANGPLEANPENKIKISILGAVAEYEKCKIKERTMRGRYEKARQGLIVGGRCPFGYSYNEGHYTVNEEQAAIVRRIFTWHAEGMSIRSIATKLNTLGIR